VVAAYLIPTVLPALPRSVSAERGTANAAQATGLRCGARPEPTASCAQGVRARRRCDIVPFIKSDMPVQAKGSIVEIVVGPSAAAGAEDGVYALLKPFHDGPNAIVRQANVPRI
jgi:hypothetical protein